MLRDDSPRTVRLVPISSLLFASGFCALIYQTVWLRQFRLVFGASTAASAAVLAIFMGGLGVGGLVLGRRAERSRNPLAMYGTLELGVAISAGLTPLLLFVARGAYLAIGGSFGIGPFFAAVVRIVLATLVLGVPTTLMGGTLPAAARAAEAAGDDTRRGLATIYGLNTLGAVAGALLSTFVLLEHFGNLRTLIAAALVNTLVGLTAILVSNSIRGAGSRRGAARDEIGEDEDTAERATAQVVAAAAGPRLVYGAAAVCGFSFLLMELVWYRMLTPLLGGTTFTFGLILAVALLGIGSGSWAYSIGRRARATASGFALCCALEALFIALPLALGDRVAVFALLLRSVGAVGFHGYAFGWLLVTMLVVFVPAFVSGLQFPLLVSLLGKGRAGVAREVGQTYAWNTAGAIAGSLAGGFGLLPLLTAPGVWRLVVALLALLAFCAAAVSHGRSRASAVAAAVCAIALLFARGPTAFWRHTPIGAGRVDTSRLTPNRLRDMESARRRETIWEADGVESSVALADDDGYAFIVNGKGDGHARLDAGTQVMGGVLAGILHPNPRRAVVIGLGTGSTAGWIGALPSIERVDAVEIEPAIGRVAEMCRAVNQNMPGNPKVRVTWGDGREFLLARKQLYDVISSEPSNPYRAGIASLFTVEFYRACLSRLDRGGVFIQFLQAYEVDAPTIRTAFGTIHSVFPFVEVWQSKSGDLLLAGSREPLQYDARTLQQRLSSPVVREGLRLVWWATDVESVLAHYVCGTATVDALGSASRLNTDDRTLIEYSFARTLGNADSFRASELREYARARGDDLPASVRALAPVVERRRASIGVLDNSILDFGGSPDAPRLVGSAQNAYVSADYATTWTLWQAIGRPETPLEAAGLAEAIANRGDDQALPLIEALRRVAPVEADALLARLRWRQGKAMESAVAFRAAFTAYRSNPWPLPLVMRRAIFLTMEIGRDPNGRAIIPELLEALSQPFAVGMFESARRSALLLLAHEQSGGIVCNAAEMRLVAAYEPDVPWQRDYLRERVRCYEQNHDPRLEQARRDWVAFAAREKQPLAP